MNTANNVYQLLMDMIKNEQNFGAYWIYLALKKGYLQKHDPVDKMYDVPFTQEEIDKIYAMDAQDVLGINRVKLYATELDKNIYAFYFAENPGDAQQLHQQLYGHHATKWHSVYKQLQAKPVILASGETISWWELKERYVKFPVHVWLVDKKMLEEYYAEIDELSKKLFAN